MGHNIKKATIWMAILIIIGVIGLMLVTKKTPIINSKYDKWLIDSRTEEQYIALLGGVLKTTYAPGNGMDKKDIKKSLMLYTTEQVADLMSTENTKSTVNNSDVTCNIRQILLCYGAHQEDGITRVIASLHIETKDHYKDITLELRLNENDKIYEVDVW